ncbi:MAG: radical SAM protein [Candidatus Omnitrophica bacterium]|nr:radical SAM protein [Candidatus Omnitrophota bacterium]
MAIRIQEYKDFSLRLHDKGSRKPILGQFELTHNCNLACQHCYVVNEPQRQELSYSELCRIFDEVYEQGCFWLCFTGGEPLLRKDFLDIYSYAYKKGFLISIFTNATLFNENIAGHLKDFPPFCIEVTLNGITKKTYELISQRPGSFELAMRGIELIRKFKLPLKLKCQIMTLNIDEIDLMRKFYDKMNMAFLCSLIINPRLDGSTQTTSLRLPIEKILELRRQKEGLAECSDSSRDILGMLMLPDKKEDIFLEEDSSFDGDNELNLASDALFRCPGGTWAFYVNPYGELCFCNSLREPAWDLRKNSFKQGFYEFFPKIRSEKFKTDSKCRDCDIKSDCLSCPARAYLETGDREAPLPYYCELAQKNRKKEIRT